MMPDCTITITGPGGVINNELAIIEDALSRVGYDVTVKNDHPDNVNLEKTLQILKTVGGKRTVEIVMHHCPWGG